MRAARHRSSRLALAMVVLTFAWLTWRDRWVAEDAFITFRYARNLVDGHGLRFNPGDVRPVEGYSNFLWLLTAALCLACGVDPAVGTTLLAALSGAACVVFTHHAGRRYLGLDPAAALTSSLVLACYRPFVTWSTSGLEHVPQTLALLVASCMVAFEERPRLHVLGGLFALALALLRFEGIAWVGVVCLLAAGVRAWEGRPITGPLVRFLAPVALGFAAYLWWRHAAFGRWLSQPARMKQVAPRALLLGRGFRYAETYAFSLGLPLMTPVTPVVADPSRRARWAWAALLALSHPLWAVLVGGDYMPAWRFTVPSAPFTALCAVGMLQPVITHAPRATVPSAALLTLASALPTLFGGTLLPHRLLAALRPTPAAILLGDGGQNFVNDALVHAHQHRNLSQLTRPGDRAVLLAVGRNAWFNPELHVVDQCGLTAEQPELLEVRRGLFSWRAGHDSCLPHTAFHHYDPDVVAFTSLVAIRPRLAAMRLRAVAAHHLGLTPSTRRRTLYPAQASTQVDDTTRVYSLVLRRAADVEEWREGWRAWEADLDALQRR